MDERRGASDRLLEARFLGRVGYGEAAGIQVRLRQALLDGSGVDSLLLLEHPHVFTLGRNADAHDIKASRIWLEGHGVEVAETDRGGQVTYHGPGQLVGYPIVDLNPDRRDLRRYVRDLQEVLVAVLAELGISAYAGERERIGVWVESSRGPAKIASIGVHLKRWVTTHGFALNVSTDLELFGGIVACGLPDVRMTSVEELTGDRVPLEHAAEICAQKFAERFERRLVWRLPAAARPPGDQGSLAVSES